MECLNLMITEDTVNGGDRILAEKKNMEAAGETAIIRDPNLMIMIQTGFLSATREDPDMKMTTIADVSQSMEVREATTNRDGMTSADMETVMMNGLPAESGVEANHIIPVAMAVADMTNGQKAGSREEPMMMTDDQATIRECPAITMIVDLEILKEVDMMTWDQVVAGRVGPAIMETGAMVEIVNSTIPATGALVTREVQDMTADVGWKIMEGQAAEAIVIPGAASIMMTAVEETGNTNRPVNIKHIDMNAD